MALSSSLDSDSDENLDCNGLLPSSPISAHDISLNHSIDNILNDEDQPSNISEFDSFDSEDEQLPLFPPFEDLNAENNVEAEFSAELEPQDSADFCRIHGSAMATSMSDLPEISPSPNLLNTLEQDKSLGLSMAMNLTSVVGGTLSEDSMFSNINRSILTLSCLSQRHLFGQALVQQW